MSNLTNSISRAWKAFRHGQEVYEDTKAISNIVVSVLAIGGKVLRPQLDRTTTSTFDRVVDRVPDIGWTPQIDQFFATFMMRERFRREHRLLLDQYFIYEGGETNEAIERYFKRRAYNWVMNDPETGESDLEQWMIEFLELDTHEERRARADRDNFRLDKVYSLSGISGSVVSGISRVRQSVSSVLKERNKKLEEVRVNTSLGRRTRWLLLALAAAPFAAFIIWIVTL